MDKLTVIIDGVEYALATTLRVAYMVQGQHNHKPYTEVFAEMGDMPLEDQIGILYVAFKCANQTQVQTITQQKFLDYYLDNFTLKDVMSQLQKVIAGIMGEDSEAPAAPAQVQDDQEKPSEP